MDQSLLVLYAAAVSIALVHTLCGPDHYVPFVAMSRACKWSLRKTMIVTLISGLGHVGSSVLLGFLGITFGIVLSNVEVVEEMRGRTAGWLLILFGFGYLTWGIIQSRRGQPHLHLDGHTHGLPGATTHVHGHSHAPQPEGNSNENSPPSSQLTPWILFTIFIFGPCEPLIPLLMYPAARSSVWGVVLVTGLFSITTIVTMLTTVFCLVRGTTVFRVPALSRYSHALAGTVVMLCGIAINFGL